jgi:3-phosphoshikimate 1-carboxyvinyltransferase
MASIAAATIKPARRVRGRVKLAGDKSISHRYALLAALARGTSTISGYAEGADCAATLECLQHLGVEVSVRRDRRDGVRIVDVSGRGLQGFQPPGSVLDARNSGTTMRLLSGVLAAHPFTVTITGDDSLRRRPMARVIEPLEEMGATIDSNGKRPPLTIHGAALHGITHRTLVPSAQVKSAVLLAGLQAEGRTRVVEPAPTRNHTELALRALGAEVSVNGKTVEVTGGRILPAQDLVVPGDLSSAAFWLAAAAALPDSDVEIENVGLNPTRTALLALLTRAGASIETEVTREAGGEPSGLICGDAQCGEGETVSMCPEDCRPDAALAADCRNGICEMGESSGDCPEDCGADAVCGNSLCEGTEESSCPIDCGAGGGGCCGAGDPCGWADDGVCDCGGVFVWDGNYYALEVMRRLDLEDGAVRVGIVHYNTAEEVDRLLGELERL